MDDLPNLPFSHRGKRLWTNEERKDHMMLSFLCGLGMGGALTAIGFAVAMLTT